jgi:hypothetical protein
MHLVSSGKHVNRCIRMLAFLRNIDRARSRILTHPEVEPSFEQHATGTIGRAILLAVEVSADAEVRERSPRLYYHIMRLEGL